MTATAIAAENSMDLQFGHSQRVGYDVATNVLSQLQRIGDLHKRRPEHASLGVLRMRILRAPAPPLTTPATPTPISTTTSRKMKTSTMRNTLPTNRFAL